MGEGGIRNYQVNYAINATGDAAQFFQTMAEKANALTEPLKALQAQVSQVNTALTSVRDMLNSALRLNLTGLNEDLKKAEETVTTSAAKMAKSLEKALGKGASINAGQVAGQAKKSAQEMVTSLRSEMDQVVKDFDNTKGKLIKKSLKDLDDKGRMAVTKNMLKGDEQLTGLYDRYVELNKQMVRAQKTIAKPSKTATAIIDMAADFKTLNLTADAIRNLNGAVAGFNNRKAVSVKIDANAKKAIGVLNGFLKKARESTAVVPLSAKPTEAAKKGGKGAGKATKGVVTPVSETVTNVMKGKERLAEIQAKLSGGELVGQLTKAINELQKLANEKPVAIKAIFSLDKAGYQMHQAINGLQKIADGKPIVLKATTSAPTVPNNGTATSNAVAAAVQSANTAIATVGKNGKGSVQVNTGGWIDPTPAQVRAYERHNQQMSDLRISNAVDLIKQKEKFDKIARVSS